MPALLVRDERDASAFDGLGENGERLACPGRRRPGPPDFFQIVTIDHFGSPAKGRETTLVDFHIVTKSRRLALTQAVHVDNRDKVVEVVRPASDAASQTLPSAHSPSPSRT
jgi:hypothetical protein